MLIGRLSRATRTAGIRLSGSCRVIVASRLSVSAPFAPCSGDRAATRLSGARDASTATGWRLRGRCKEARAEVTPREVPARLASPSQGPSPPRRPRWAAARPRTGSSIGEESRTHVTGLDGQSSLDKRVAPSSEHTSNVARHRRQRTENSGAGRRRFCGSAGHPVTT